MSLALNLTLNGNASWLAPFHGYQPMVNTLQNSTVRSLVSPKMLKPGGETEAKGYHLAWDMGDMFEPNADTWHTEVFALTQEKADLTPTSVDEFLREQASHAYCKQVARTVGTTGSHFGYDRQGYLVRKSNLAGVLPMVVSLPLRPRIIYQAHYQRLPGHPGGTKTFMIRRWEYYWPLMANDLSAVLRNCRLCADLRQTKYKVQQHLKVFPAPGPFESILMDLLGSFSRTERFY